MGLNSEKLQNVLIFSINNEYHYLGYNNNFKHYLGTDLIQNQNWPGFKTSLEAIQNCKNEIDRCFNKVPITNQPLNKRNWEQLFDKEIEDIEIFFIEDNNIKALTISVFLRSNHSFSNTSYNRVVKYLNEGIIIHDIDDKVIFCNPSASSILKLTDDQLKGKERFDPTWRALKISGEPLLEDQLPNVVARKTKRPVKNFKMIVKTGKEKRKIINVNSEPVFNEDGNHIETITSFLDVTQDWENRRVLQNQKKQIDNIANSVPGILLQYRLDTRMNDYIDYISDGVHDLWEVSKEEAMDDVNNLWNVVYQDDLEDMRRSVQESASNLSIWEYKWRIATKSGTTKWLKGIGHPKKLEDGSILWDTLILNLTDEKKAQDQLIEVNNRMELAVKTANLGIWTYDLDNDHLEWNDVMYQLYNYEKDDFNHKISDWYAKIYEKDLKIIEKSIDSIKGGKTFDEISFRIVPRDNQINHVRASSIPVFDSFGQVIKLIGICVDITGFVEKEQYLSKTLYDKGALFKEMHHRIKNNLNLIISLLYLKEKDLENSDMIDFLRDTRGRILAISDIHDLLQKLEEVDQLGTKNYLTELIYSINNTYAIHPKHYDLEMKIEDHQMYVDKVLILGLILNEVLSNAFKYAYEPDVGGKISISFLKKNSHYQLSISDFGKGFSSKHIASTGLKLIELFTKQLRGSLEIIQSNGVSYIISFPD